MLFIMIFQNYYVTLPLYTFSLLHMRLHPTSWRGALLGLCLAVTQSCSHHSDDLPVPAPTKATTDLLAESSGTCMDWYNGATGEYITTTGYCGGSSAPPMYVPPTGSGGDSGGPTGTSGGGGTRGSLARLTSTFTYASTTDSEEPDLPSDCGSWQFRAVTSNGYLACGVKNIEIDLLSDYYVDDQTHGISLNIYKANLFFEMPARYSPGEAATLCARIKDEVEELLEEKYRYEYPPDIAQTINSAFIREMTNRITPLGGRVTSTPRYSNTPVAEYSHTFLPNNGGCS